MTPLSRTKTSQGRNKARARLYSFRLSQIRVVSENCFARLKGRWTILRQIPFGPEQSGLIVYACCCLHNFVQSRGEPILNSWFRALTELDVESTDVAFSTPSLASLRRARGGVQRRIEIVKRLGMGWEEETDDEESEDGEEMQT